MLRLLAITGLDIEGWAPLGCVIRQNHLGKLRTALGVAVCIVSIGFLAGPVRRASTSRRVAFVAKYTSSASLFLTYAFYISISNVIFETFACMEFSDGTRFLRVDLLVSCDTKVYFAHRALAVIGVLTFVAGVPMMIMALLWPHRAVLSGSASEHEQERMENDNIRSLRFLWRNVRGGGGWVSCDARLLTPPRRLAPLHSIPRSSSTSRRWCACRR